MLEVTEITAGYGGHNVLVEASFSISAGEVLGVVGNNGSGKSTLLKALAGFCEVYGGRVMLDTRSIDGLAPYRRARAGLIYIPQDNRVFPSLTVEDNLVLPMLAKRRAEISRHLTESCRRWPWLEGVLKKPAGLLSGGQKLAVAVARASALRGKCYLFDEPSAGVDPSNRGMISTMIKGFRAEGCAVLIAEHDLDFASEIADRALVLSPRGVALLPSFSKPIVLKTMRDLA